MILIEELIKDEKKIDRSLYSAGSYWNYKNRSSLIEIKKKGILNFRGTSSGVGISFTDNIPSDIRNFLGAKGRLAAKFFSLPIIKKIFNGAHM